MHDDTGLEAEVRELSDVVEALLADQGGCEWNRAQTHESLVTYLVEECAELVEAIEVGSSDDRREELGDVLYQVVLHSALAARASGDAFDLADVVRDVRLKTVRRHPHVFGGENAADVDDIVRLWSAAKAVEKSSRTSAYDGVPRGLPALSRAQKLESRRVAAGALPADVGAHTADAAGAADDADVELSWGRDLLAVVDTAGRAGIDAERALRRAVREREGLLRARET
ncbi:MazG nucleotide pyrophosphohydrolase domain-containing protein [Frigoribacterium sp. PvP032]|uniref:MazG nucleotide pyrophosphohydrolase domain-containing protein n=1 Tax=Frigoribacterium sp. PvP032 TaxID=2806589 RepID=UPI001AE3EA19|nr:MazG nucleotide pyrophosphohydrolase domain-containing protein [Frigoribacterium sp. PvP032]MBP1191502.1 XTP/dITP diphosphohydrolase [Frigoribacterium sp. PvP032]